MFDRIELGEFGRVWAIGEMIEMIEMIEMGTNGEMWYILDGCRVMCNVWFDMNIVLCEMICWTGPSNVRPTNMSSAMKQFIHPPFLEIMKKSVNKYICMYIDVSIIC